MKIKSVVVFLSFLYLLAPVFSCSEKESLEHVKVEAQKPTEEEENKSEQEESEIEASLKLDQYKVRNGYHVPFALGKTKSPYGYYIYAPLSYAKISNRYPLLIFLHGSGERGNSRNNEYELAKAIKHGPGKLINAGTWAPQKEMIVVSAQTSGYWDAATLKKFIDYLIQTYHVDQKRIYLTGLSLGGFGVFDYLGAYGAESKIAAAVPICGGAQSTNSRYVKNLSGIPIWIFHGQADQNVPVKRAIDISKAVNSSAPKVKPRLTLYPNVAHDSWTMTYDGSGRGRENPNYQHFDRDIYSWLLQYSRP